ncbi:MAG: hypothetical protein NVSMB56_08210 [Pyrinomonadaceae bacterium]
MNYYNYFTEIEDTFIQRRGKHLFLSPLDWALIESWKERGVPLHIVLRAIEKVFDNQAAQARRRSIKTLLYCQEEVEAQFAEWLEMQIGASNGVGAESEGEMSGEEISQPFSRAAISQYLESSLAAIEQILNERKKIRADDFCDILARVASRLKELTNDFASGAQTQTESLEQSLTSLEKLLNDALPMSIPPHELNAAREATAQQLKPYRNRMESAVYEQTFDNLLLKSLREKHSLPRLSLFYL